MNKITEQHGFDASALREVELHSNYKAAWEKRRDALKAMRLTVNALVDEVVALREAVERRPFA